MRKDVIGILRLYGLRITCDIGLHQVDFLDLTLNLSTGKHWPYRKTNDKLLYIDARSNHPSKRINQLPKMIAARVSTNSCKNEEFDKAKPDFEEALEKSHPSVLSYSPSNEQQKAKKNRSRNVIWFNPHLASTWPPMSEKNFLANRQEFILATPATT